ncbi:MAG: LysR substrate-binding domain-containing protein [Hoeflea sp.]|uniref:LysR family transcriptional regulator n=1 Tax=Hoeflea sp. TaxID=1940281 RepID=UPI00272F544D|nr:LysR substrate-binding domain-containing protein [Hoeflea sp.]MDP2121377.1 LysR substrate-binding domain-containing protein [Hoeflea sp.]
MDELIDLGLDDLALFARVVEAGGFTAAARRTGMPQATISRRIAQLEQRLGLPLLIRTTRRIALTEVGRRVHEHAHLMLGQASAALGAAAEMAREPAGRLKVSAPVILGQAFISSIMADFLLEHPKVNACLEWTTRIVDPLEEDVDVAIRVAQPPHPALSVVTLGRTRTRVYASPGWSGPDPSCPADLAGLEVFGIGRALEADEVSFMRGGEVTTVKIPRRMMANDVQPIIAAAARTGGVAFLPDFAAPVGWRELLTDWSTSNHEITALSAASRGALPKVRLFLDALKSGLAGAQRRHSA